jgi:hypothetical protein
MITFAHLLKNEQVKELQKELERLKRYDWINLKATPPIDQDFQDDTLIEFSDGEEVWHDPWTYWEHHLAKGATHWRVVSLPKK